MILPFRPADLKKGIVGKLGSSKAEVGACLREKVLCVDTLLEDFPKGKREHLQDALGHAYLGLVELHRLRTTLGVQL